MEGLEHDAHVPAPETGERVLVEDAEIVAGHRDLPGGGPLQAADDHEERGLSRPGRPDDAHRFAGGEIEIDPAQDLHRAGRPVSVTPRPRSDTMQGRETESAW